MIIFKNNLYFAVGTVVFSILVTWQSFIYPARSALFPRFISLLMLGLSFVLFIKGWKIFSKNKFEKENVKRFSVLWVIAKNPAFIVLNVLLFYVLGINYIGYFISTAVFIGTTMFILGQKNLLFVLITPLFFTALLYYVFSRLLGVPLPTGLLF